MKKYTKKSAKLVVPSAELKEVLSERRTATLLKMVKDLKEWAKEHEIELDEAIGQIHFHLNKVHRLDVARVEKINSEIQRELTGVKIQMKAIARLKRIDLTKRPIKLATSGTCDQCSRRHFDLWKYKRMDGTPFNCCKFCREILIERERGRVDAMTKAISGGGFETSRR